LRPLTLDVQENVLMRLFVPVEFEQVSFVLPAVRLTNSGTIRPSSQKEDRHYASPARGR